MNEPGDNMKSAGLRERKKALTRATILANAKRLFDERGFDRVTTAEIAGASNVSVKTLFSYFEAKEDLLFAGESEFLELILDVIRHRRADATPFEAIAEYVRYLSNPKHNQALEALTVLQQSHGGSRAIKARLSLMWQRFEDEISALLHEERPDPSAGPLNRLTAANIISIFRVLASEELSAYLNGKPKRARAQAFAEWGEEVLMLVGDGLRHGESRHSP